MDQRKPRNCPAGHTHCDISSVPQVPFSREQIASLDTAPEAEQAAFSEAIAEVCRQLREARSCYGGVKLEGCDRKLSRAEVMVARIRSRRPSRLRDI